MVIAIITPWFSENMGYAENKLPNALAKLGCEVHLISSDMQIYATAPELYKVYEPFLGPAIVETGIAHKESYTLHRTHHYITKYGIGLKDLREKLKAIQPEVVYLFEVNTEHTMQAAEYKAELNYKIYVESRLHLSVFTPPKTIKRKLRHYFKEYLRWKRVGLSFEKCYPVAPDVLYVICKYFGQDKRKCKLSSLAVDTDVFVPVSTNNEKQKRKELRDKLGFRDDDIVCVYTGRFTDDKGTIILAKAIDLLQKQGSINFKAVFVGTGDDKYEANIKGHKGCYIHPFVQSSELVAFYQSAEIGVWPKQESTSQLDAIACGLPIIVSSAVDDVDRITGNGLSYQHENVEDLASKIKSLENFHVRNEMRMIGLDKIRRFYSWDYIAQSRLNDFKGVA